MKSKLAITFMGILIFLLGAIAGSAGRYLYSERRTAVQPRTTSRVDRVVEGMAKELQLDANQKEAVKVIIEESRKRYRELSLQFRPEYMKIRNASDERIKALLREDQKARFEEFLKKIKSSQTTAPRPAVQK
jgi:uncharacterized membrane protein